MGRLPGLLGSSLVYLCIGTVIAEGIVVAYVWTHGYLDQEKVARMADIARGIEVTPARAEQTAKSAEAPEQPSFEEIERRRGIKARHLELREQSVQNGLERIRFEQRKLTDEKDRYELLKNSFEKVLSEKKDSVVLAGRENVRLIWENIKSKQAKEQILQMIEVGEVNEVVSILSSISIAKRAKIISEFKTEEEAKKLDEILRLIRQGSPDVQPIDQAREELKKFNPKKS
jgi:hypothetical protein